MKSYAFVGAIAALSTYLATFGTRWLSPRIRAVIPPSERRVNTYPMPTMGGAGMYFAFLVSMIVASRMPSFRPVFEGSSEPLGVVLASSVMFFVGLVDDLWKAWGRGGGDGISAPAKAAGTVVAGSLLYFLGVTMFFFRVPFADVVVLSEDLIPLATVSWLFFISSAINYIDGLDGLAAGIVAIGAGSFFLYADRLLDVGLLTSDNIGPLVAVIVVGMCVGFMPHNFHPARIMLGDQGALFLGTLMAATTLVVGGRTDDPFSGQTFFFYAPIFIPVFIMGVPLFDAITITLRRAARGGGVAKADKGHLHHRLVALGHGQRRAVVILWFWTALLSGFVLYPTFSNRGNHLIPIGTLMLAVLLFTYFHPGLRSGLEPADPEAEPQEPRNLDLRG